MFGRMNVEGIIAVDAKAGLDDVVGTLMEATEQTQIVRWIEFPESLLVFLEVPGDAKSCAVYVLHRGKGIWYWVDFQDEQYGGYARSDLEKLLWEYDFLSLVERPSLLAGGLPWVLELGQKAVAQRGYTASEVEKLLSQHEVDA